MTWKDVRAKCALGQMMIIEPDVTIHRLFQAFSTLERVDAQEVRDPAVEAFDHANRWWPARAGQALLDA